jgi:hypothetical protein
VGADVRLLAKKLVVDVGDPFACIVTGTAGLKLIEPCGAGLRPVTGLEA